MCFSFVSPPTRADFMEKLIITVALKKKSCCRDIFFFFMWRFGPKKICLKSVTLGASISSPGILGVYFHFCGVLWCVLWR